MTREPQASVVPGEILFGEGDIEINAGAVRIEMEIVNTGDRPVQVGSHVHLPQANAALSSTGTPRTVTGSTFPPAPRCDSNPVCRNGSRWFRWAVPARCTA